LLPLARHSRESGHPFCSPVIPAKAGIHSARADYQPMREQRAASANLQRKRRGFTFSRECPLSREHRASRGELKGTRNDLLVVIRFATAGLTNQVPLMVRKTRTGPCSDFDYNIV
jgi:hypothetical protein